MSRPRGVPAALVVDANIFVAAVLGSMTGTHLDLISGRRSLITSEEAFDEAYRVVEHIRPNDLSVLESLLDLLTIIAREDVADKDRAMAETALKNAPAFRNGSVTDAHLLALAWTLDADLWSHDRDFAGTGWPSWSTSNLLAAV
ncbi:PIN domain-containing protein [Microvirga sp. HBU67558]|uniref:PIN domain-containing protein n=1 Tax=Microvirga TaxID=186650 RepID=UPI001B36FCB4|nr:MULTISPECIES: PIN domain-containing protein [unclassified Microvirga]MBQ0820439.1 PIN domain-containing protein [Microvirga sp. HBU67558]